MHAMYSELIGIPGVVWARFREAQKAKGLPGAIMMIAWLATQVLLTPWYKLTMGRRRFVFKGNNLRYFCHWYNTTALNERAVEVAIALHLIKEAKGKRILEIGNVLSHYTKTHWDILDKYEKGEGVIHEDIVNFQPKEKYDLIVSISTLEHVGFDETPKDPKKFERAVKNVRSMLAPGGKLYVTIPVAYNRDAVDSLQRANLFPTLHYYNHVSKNEWKEVNREEALAQKFNTPFQFANGLILCLDGEWNG